MPFTTWPDRADVPRNAARALRYMERFVIVTQGEVFYITQVLAELEGLERGPAGNTSLAAAFALAQQMREEQIVVVQETEYTGAGKHPLSQLNLAKQLGIAVVRGDPRTSTPGQTIVIPHHPSQLGVVEVDLDQLRRLYLRNALHTLPRGQALTEADIAFLAADTHSTQAYVQEVIHELAGKG
jgi:hypothetical protein